jgi:hypothetical protein
LQFKGKVRSPFRASQAVGVRLKRLKKQTIPKKKQFLTLLLQMIGSLPTEVLVERITAPYLSKRELAMRQLEVILRDRERFMDEDKLQKAQWKREKAKNRLLGDSSNK